ncbi:MAG: hypothetical protein IJ744_10575 [Lachnospiraceae bacterium]|nr:hypothetical protein [Lachnospiraceae bacterium]
MDETVSLFRYEGVKDENFLCHYAFTQTAYETAKRAHDGQKDKGGRPYFYHPLSVCYILHGVSAYDPRLLTDAFFETPICLTDEKDCDLTSIALLHDVLEDTPITAEDLASLGFSEFIISHVKKLTHKKSQRYDLYINSLKEDTTACLLKIADMLHNSNLARTKEPTKLLKQWRERYIRGIHELWPILQSAGIRHNIKLPETEEFQDLR